MRNKYPFILSTLVLGGTILLQSYSSGPAASNARATGAPGDGASTCVTCHNSGGSFGTINIDLEIEDDNGNAVTEYKADSSYLMTVTVNNSMGSPAGYGFQMICLEDDGNSNVPGWSNPSSNAQLSVSAGRNYVEHDGMSTSNEFSVHWTAPAAGMGDLTFYIGANAVNGNGQNSGDRAALTSVTISEIPSDTGDTTSGIFDVPTEASWSVFPNPAHEVIQVSGLPFQAQVAIYDVRGVRVRAASLQGNGQLALGDLEPGLYFVQHLEDKTVKRILVH